MRIVTADSSAAVLNEKYEPLTIVASAAVLVEPPYREAQDCIVEPIFASADGGHELIIHEAELCRDLLGKVKADVVHLDMSLGSVPLDQLSPIDLTNIGVSTRAKRHLLKILPRMRKISTEITQKHAIDVLAIGKESIPVRIAELTSGAHAIIYACQKAVKDKTDLLLGLPSKCEPRMSENWVCLHSLIEAEHDIRGCAQDKEGIIGKVNIAVMMNPIARGFRILKLTLK